MTSRSKWVAGQDTVEFQGDLNREDALVLADQYYEDLKSKALGQLEQVLNAIRTEASKGMMTVVWDPKIFKGCEKIQHSDYTAKLVEELLNRGFRVVIQRNATEEFKLLIGWQRNDPVRKKKKAIFNGNIITEDKYAIKYSKEKAYIQERIDNRREDSWLDDE